MNFLNKVNQIKTYKKHLGVISLTAVLLFALCNSFNSSKIDIVKAHLIKRDIASEKKQIPSAVTSEKITLIHIILEKSVDKWAAAYLQEYTETGHPPKAWFHQGIWGGVMIVPVPRIENLNELTLEDALRQSWYYRNATEEVLQAEKDKVAVFVANPKDEAIWIDSAAAELKIYQNLKKDWYLNPVNWIRKNEFSREFVKNLKTNYRNYIYDSGIYKDYNFIGNVHDPVGDYNMFSGVVTNPDMLESSVLFVPKKYRRDSTETKIFSGSQKIKCSKILSD